MTALYRIHYTRSRPIPNDIVGVVYVNSISVSQALSVVHTSVPFASSIDSVHVEIYNEQTKQFADVSGIERMLKYWLAYIKEAKAF